MRLANAGSAEIQLNTCIRLMLQKIWPWRKIHKHSQINYNSSRNKGKALSLIREGAAASEPYAIKNTANAFSQGLSAREFAGAIIAIIVRKMLLIFDLCSFNLFCPQSEPKNLTLLY
jgi:hypothetical protein